MVTGSGNIASETRPLVDWTAVGLSCPGTLELAIGENRGIAIEAEDNILPLIETVIEGGRLAIRFTDGLRQIRPTQPIHFRAATPEVDAIAVSGSGDVRTSEIAGEELTLDVSGSGRINVSSASLRSLETRVSGSGDVSVQGSASEQEVEVSGSGNLQAGDLTSQSAHVNVSGSGSAIVRAEREIVGRISGSGSIVYGGQPSVNVRVSGSGRAVQAPG